MEKGTYIFDDINRIINDNSSGDIRKVFSEISLFLSEKLGIKTYFCKIFTNRWSFFEGVSDSIAAEKRVKINDDYGIIIMDNKLTDDEWDVIVDKLKHVIPHD